MDQLADHKVSSVITLPGTRTWIASGKKEASLATGTIGDDKARVLTYGGKKAFDHSVIAMAAIDATTVAMTDGQWVTKLTLAEGARALKPEQRIRLPGEMGWNAGLAAARDLIVVASDLRLGAWDGAAPRFVEAKGGFAENFRCPAILPDGETILVGRGDGRIELRDLRTLELRRSFPAVREAVLGVCVLDEHTVAVAGDMADTVLLDLSTGAQVKLDVRSMKTSGLHRLPDGRLLVVGLSRAIAIFDGATRGAEGDLSRTIGDRYVQDSALVDKDTLLVACEEKGLWKVSLGALPQAAPNPYAPSAEQGRTRAVDAAAGRTRGGGPTCLVEQRVAVAGAVETRRSVRTADLAATRAVLDRERERRLGRRLAGLTRATQREVEPARQAGATHEALDVEATRLALGLRADPHGRARADEIARLVLARDGVEVCGARGDAVGRQREQTGVLEILVAGRVARAALAEGDAAVLEIVGDHAAAAQVEPAERVGGRGAVVGGARRRLGVAATPAATGRDEDQRHE